MKYRKLRITWSVAWGLLAVLLCVLWVRSYWRTEIIDLPISGRLGMGLLLSDGAIAVQFGESRKLRLLANELQSVDFRGAALIEYDLSKPIPPPTPEPIRKPGTRFRLSAAYARAPCWFVTLVVAAVASVPWLRWRYSLRTLLIATTVIAAVLGIIVWMSRAG